LAVKNRLARGLSIGFTALEHQAIPGSKGRRFSKVFISEISVVSCPANIDCGISLIRAIDTQPAAAQLAHEIAALRRDLDVAGAETADLRSQLTKASDHLDTLRRDLDTSNAETAELRGKLAAVQVTKAGMEYCGVWDPTRSNYTKGMVVTWDGSLFCAERDTNAKPGSGEDTGWRLAVKRGERGASAYQVARHNGFSGDEKAWLASLRARSGTAEPRK
jgi:hypothetical protein